MVDESKKLTELLQVDAHLVDELSQRHLLRSRQAVKVTAVALGVVDGLDNADTHQQICVFIGDLWLQRTDAFAEAFFRPNGEAAVEFAENGFQALRVESGGLPEIGGRGLEERVWVERVELGVVAGGQ